METKEIQAAFRSERIRSLWMAIGRCLKLAGLERRLTRFPWPKTAELI